ncbi:VIT1/CCC1 transporter family protein [Clostridium sp. 'White wine YQ']|uniref:VIT1/CCC1 transporter family protein n=1 Tax=Clostridium sp. 'White wine YQ' TaxID=3027474 RepID=UPI002365FE36|nr:VIT1/CCC1 transporter family protein [Clostridium sp. 'White wine YQ']MDD7795705.1 VIT1/CCC1 transporter family protein [Clostridium sp. 'White wine YQ']
MKEVKNLTYESKEILEIVQKEEITAYHIYNNIAKKIKSDSNKKILENIANDEKKHSAIWMKYTHKDTSPNKLKVFWYTLISQILGFTFAIKLMERSEEISAKYYALLSKEIPEALKILQEEERHEDELIAMLDEEKLKYVGSIVLGLNDALVEITGTLAGLILAIQNTKIIALLGLVTGISATISMASSDYLASRSEGRKDAAKSATYTGMSYIVTVILLVLPFLIFNNSQYILATIVMVITTLLIIAAFNYYISVAQGAPFKKRFFEMASISIGVSFIAFIIGVAIKHFLGISI